ncbi:unnamed protein product [Rotaria magnacalcarata]|uniref:SGTA homodimerisation domain-containing protein n=1 Tax=Rotaria magnacalcarata TaxID=392030 RepID=A0A819KNL9_9BILA|nr:unnamed protein product [Rotaria magnacalcarata]CAF1682106.1 unnamed protein product [Rotaria magnacalcarata]CAF2077103.1 unnamed protein product [Rotaria magnacalcarata]CAF2086329.1 unnamed protein product [Rotaria magnacalcarata]CAF2159146.1 unnamed protein product [Rotaria magnacalcarata]
MSQQEIDKQRLVYAILKFLEGEIQTETNNAERRESMEVAVQCLETAYDVSLANTQNESVYGPVIELLPLVTEISIATEAAQSISFTSWPHTSEQLPMSVPLTDDMRQQADKLKNEGNEFVKQEKYREALEAYNAAMKIDGNNAIYYCNRAAAHNKLNNNDQALSDCFRSIEIDPNYSKAYGRLGVIYLSLDKVHEALDAYKKAHALEPNNENYKQSIRICEERLVSMPGGATPPGGPNLQAMFGSLLGGMGGMSGPGVGAAAAGGPDMMSFFNNPSLMNMAMQFVQNPQVQGLMANLVTNLGAQEGGEVGLQTLLQTGQRMASELSANNPDLIESIRRNMGNREQPDGNTDGGPDGTSNGSSNPNNSSDQDKPSS